MSWKVPFLDLRVTDEGERRELLEAVEATLRHGRLVMGPEVGELERAVAATVGRNYGVGVNSGTDALFLGLKALGVGPGDEVVTTALSWIATANAIALTGAVPVFADIRDDLNIDPESVARLLNDRTKAVLVVHYTGKICDMEPILAAAGRRGIPVVEDASQAFGAHRGGRVSGAWGTMACFSMNPMKIFAACGEAGIVLVDDDRLRDRLEILRYNGTVNREVCVEPSLNGRLDTVQAAILLRRLPRVPGVIATRRRNAARYHEALRGVVGLPEEETGEMQVYYTFTVRTPRRDELKCFLEQRGIEVKIQHPRLMPDQPAYRGCRRECPRAQELVHQILCLPVHEKLTVADIDFVASSIRDCLN
ncbi:MAG: DegT/DnrJ/EryC1/StrS family aminotransferase [Candidatus Methylomirabilia bacterium]